MVTLLFVVTVSPSTIVVASPSRGSYDNCVTIINIIVSNRCNSASSNAIIGWSEIKAHWRNFKPRKCSKARWSVKRAREFTSTLLVQTHLHTKPNYLSNLDPLLISIICPLIKSMWTRSPLFSGKMIEFVDEVLFVPAIEVTSSPFNIRDTLKNTYICKPFYKIHSRWKIKIHFSTYFHSIQSFLLEVSYRVWG